MLNNTALLELNKKKISIVTMTTMTTLSYVLNSGCSMKAQLMHKNTVSTQTSDPNSDPNVEKKTVGTQTSDPNKEKPYIHVIVELKDITLLQGVLNSRYTTLEIIDTTLEIINEVDPETGQTALHWAISNDWFEGAKLLLSNQHINVHIQDLNGNTVLHSVILKKQESNDLPQLEELIDLIIQCKEKSTSSGKIIFKPNKIGNTALHLVAMMESHEKATGIANKLLSTVPPRSNIEYDGSSTDFNSKNKDGKTALNIALENKNELLAIILGDFLLKQEILLDSSDPDLETLLNLALQNENEPGSQRIINHLIK